MNKIILGLVIALLTLFLVWGAYAHSDDQKQNDTTNIMDEMHNYTNDYMSEYFQGHDIFASRHADEYCHTSYSSDLEENPLEEA
jgi:hypothetical protein